MKKIKFIFLFIFASIVFMIIGYWYGYKLVWIPKLEMASLANTGKGTDYFEKGEYIKAIAYLNRAVAIDPDDYWIHIVLADSYYFNGNLQLAMEEYEIAIRLNTLQSHDKYIKDQIEKIRISLSQNKPHDLAEPCR